MTQQYHTDAEGLAIIAKELMPFINKLNEPSPPLSKGFVRWQKMPFKQKRLLYMKYNFNQNVAIASLQD